MTADYSPIEAARLIAEAREDDARMTLLPWSAPVQLGANATGIARTRNNLPAITDQLEAAGREIGRTKLDAAAAEHGRLVAIEHYGVLFAERDSLRQQLDDAHRERGIAFAEREHANDWMGRIKPEYEKLQIDLAAAQQRIAELEADRDAHRAMVCDLLASAYPHPVEHPAMTWQWARARVLLKNGPPSVETLGAAARTLSEWRQMYSDAEGFHVERERALLAALRAVWPVLLRARAWEGRYPHHQDWLVTGALREAIDSANAAITSDILAALKAAGLEIE